MWLPAYKCCQLMSRPLSPISVYYSSGLLEHEARASILWHLKISEYLILVFMHLLVFASVGAVSYECMGVLISRLLWFLLRFRLIFQLYSRLRAQSSHVEVCVQLCFYLRSFSKFGRGRLGAMRHRWALVLLYSLISIHPWRTQPDSRDT